MKAIDLLKRRIKEDLVNNKQQKAREKERIESRIGQVLEYIKAAFLGQSMEEEAVIDGYYSFFFDIDEYTSGFFTDSDFGKISNALYRLGYLVSMRKITKVTEHRYGKNDFHVPINSWQAFRAHMDWKYKGWTHYIQVSVKMPLKNAPEEEDYQSI